MTALVVDASVVITFLMNEPGADLVPPLLEDARMSAINIAEVAAYFARRGAAASEVHAMLGELRVDIVPVDRELAMQAGLMAAATRSAGLSLGDRFCLALAKRLGLPAVTADRAWANVAPALGVEIRLIR